MDPLSLTASIIAIIGVGGQVAKAVRKAASLQGAPDLVLALNNEMADLNLVVVAVQGIFQRLQTTGVRSGELNADNSITSSLKQVKGKVIELAALQKRLNISISGSNVEFDKVAWLREQKKVKRMQEDLKSVRLKLAAALGVLTS